MKFSAILATDLQGAIGNNGNLIIKCSEDMKNFRRLTNNKAVIMGRKTYDSLDHFLPDRFHVIITRDAKLLKSNVNIKKEHYNDNFIDSPYVYVKSIPDAMNIVREYSKLLGWDYDVDEAMFIGGAEIYNEVISKQLVSTIYHTIFHYKVMTFDTVISVDNCAKLPIPKKFAHYPCNIYENDKNVHRIDVSFIIRKPTITWQEGEWFGK